MGLEWPSLIQQTSFNFDIQQQQQQQQQEQISNNEIATVFVANKTDNSATDGVLIDNYNLIAEEHHDVLIDPELLTFRSSPKL